MSKNIKKKGLLIIIAILLFMCTFVLAIWLVKNRTQEIPTNDIQNNNPQPPAENNIKLTENYTELKLKNISENTLTFSDEINLDENSPVILWVYSQPYYLGEFTIFKKAATSYYVPNIEKNIQNANLNFGKHYIAILQNHQCIGYIVININEKNEIELEEEKNDNVIKDNTEDNNQNSSTNDTTQNNNQNSSNNNSNSTTNSATQPPKNFTKEVTVEEDIPYTTEEQEEVNMLRGTKSVSQQGQNGKKKIVYSVTYNSYGQEISRRKTGEQITQNPINSIVKVGVSDYNMNTDTYMLAGGLSCKEEDIIKEMDYYTCDTAKVVFEFTAISLKGTYYMSCESEDFTQCDTGTKLRNLETLFPLNHYANLTFKGTYKGQNLGFTLVKGSGEPYKMTPEFCNTMGLACGKW